VAAGIPSTSTTSSLISPWDKWLIRNDLENFEGLGLDPQYLGSHKTTFYRLDGQWYHEMLLTAHRKGGTRGQYLRSNIDRAESGVFRQFHYIYFIKQSARQRLLRPVLPYPKPETALHANNQTSRETGGKP